jgi:glyoxylate reductase
MAGDKADVLVLAPKQTIVEGLERHFTVHKLWEAADGEAFLSAIAPRVRGIATAGGHAPVDAKLMARLPKLEIVASFGVGYDHVDAKWAGEHGIVVTNTPDVLTAATAEMTLALMLALTRRVIEGDRFLRRREEWQWAPTFLLGRGLAGLTLGIVGWGRIGQEVGRLARAHELTVVHAGELSLDDLLATVDIVSLHVPLTAETHHLIGARELALMKPTAYLVNTSRGPVVDEAPLAHALAERRIAGAALDVFEHEPEVAATLLELDNVVLVPHLGSATHEAREAMGMLCVESLRKALL